MKMKKILMTMVLLVVMSAGAMMLSSFTTSKQDAKTESSQIQLNGDDWMLYREGVAFCDGDTDQCKGHGNVYVNSNTYQVRIDVYYDEVHHHLDLTEYTSKEGYNYRFWHGKDNKYYYVYLNVRYN